MDKEVIKSLLNNHQFISRHDYIHDYNYIVNIGQDMFGFSKISNIKFNSNVDAYNEGGSNSRLKIVNKKKQAMETLTLEKGIAKKGSFESTYKEGRYIKELTIIVLDVLKEPEMAFYFEEGVITKRSFTSLDAGGGGIFMQTLEIKHTGLKEIKI